MKVKLSQPRATNKGPEQIGQIIEVGNAEGQRMLERGQCEEVKDFIQTNTGGKSQQRQ